jgi:hypothetical protein
VIVQQTRLPEIDQRGWMSGRIGRAGDRGSYFAGSDRQPRLAQRGAGLTFPGREDVARPLDRLLDRDQARRHVREDLEGEERIGRRQPAFAQQPG